MAPKKTPAAAPVAQQETLNDAQAPVAEQVGETGQPMTPVEPGSTIEGAPALEAPRADIPVTSGFAQVVQDDTSLFGGPGTRVDFGAPAALAPLPEGVTAAPDPVEMLPAPVEIDIPAHHRVITEHHTDLCNSRLTITVCDPPDAGGASHLYLIEGIDGSENPSIDHIPAHGPASAAILFQNGPVLEAGANGITIEALLAISIDRLRSFQKGQHACADNALALAHLTWAMRALARRSEGRMARGVEGTSAV